MQIGQAYPFPIISHLYNLNISKRYNGKPFSNILKEKHHQPPLTQIIKRTLNHSALTGTTSYSTHNIIKIFFKIMNYEYTT